MKYEERLATQEDIEQLIEIRIDAMKESLEAVDRIDPVELRFLKTFSEKYTKIIISNDEIIGFYSLKENKNHMWLHHLYMIPNKQSKGLGSIILNKAKKIAELKKKPIRLATLKNSKSNAFYMKNGFVQTDQKEWYIYYEYRV